jgi:uncharacterized RDD family membrane protein YckC
MDTAHVLGRDGQAAQAGTRAVAYAGFGRRFGSYLIDLFILSLVAAVLRRITGESAIGIVDFAQITEQGLPSALSILIAWLYFAGFESSGRRATLGKAALGVAVTDLDGNRISFPRATGRFFAKFPSAIILLIGFIMAAFTERHQALHDKLAGTLVVRT